MYRFLIIAPTVMRTALNGPKRGLARFFLCLIFTSNDLIEVGKNFKIYT